MNEQELYKLRFPIGQFEKPKQITKDLINGWISTIENFPQNVENITKNLSEVELNYNYRPNGWTIKQVVHHCADSHINSIIRFKLALTEDTPTIRPYFEDRFAKLIDYSESLEASISILKGVHHKLGVLLKNLSEDDLKREFIHPEHGKRFSIAETIGLYTWHSNHHFAHIEQALEYKGAFK
ncbi:MAG: metal-dependent hydrolase [Winogradskyella sp.]|uniref:Metal-dependent hydrolase n=1 Tax=Winogradskyella poriferorum TaxID=307627 RepID=A0ABU7W8F2_9FLAO|nr:metal-dependent hydrolase [Winogradskyella sp.]|tara:strand:+ start:586 stop:1131 length:546 start_codon:yes stop_codon:yes gene_type:complete